MTKHPIILFLPLMLSGCMGIYEGGFECPAGEGTKCKSISEVNELINRNLEGRKQGCTASIELSAIPCMPPALFPVSPTSEIWWNPLITQEIEKNLKLPQDNHNEPSGNTGV